MTKQDMFDEISEKTGLDSLTSRSVMDAFFVVVKESLTAGEPIYIRSFGSFILKQRASKVGRNIGQNTAVTIGAHVVPFFKPSPDFVNKIRGQETLIATKQAEL